MSQAYYWKTAAVIRETQDAVTIVFEPGEDGFTYRPGQYVDVTLRIGQENVTRSYSLSSVPDEDEKPAITIKKVHGGLMSEFVVNHAEEIDGWDVTGPHGFFFPTDAVMQAGDVVLIGGGSGITPLYSQLKYLLKHGTNRVWLVDVNRSLDDVIFSRPLSYMEYSFQPRFHAWHVITREAEREQPWFRDIGFSRLHELLLRKKLRQWLGPALQDAYYFLCGPEGLMDLASKTLDGLQVEGKHIFREFFLPSAMSEDSQMDPASLSVQEVLLHCMDQSNLLEVQPGQSILEAALLDHVPLRYSCKGGTCGKCAGKVTSGQVWMRSNYALPQETLEQGYVLLCQTHPIDGEVTIEVS